MSTITRTPLADQDQKLDIIEHLNNDHPAEVLAIVQAHGAAGVQAVRLEDIFEEGCLLSATVADGTQQSMFVPFVLKGDLEENVLYLAYEAMVRQGKQLGNTRKLYFTVTGSHKVSPNMLRLVLDSAVPLPENAPGHAWFFALKTLARLPAQPPASEQRMSVPMQWFNRLLLWWLKRVSSKRREQVMMSMYKGQRYYTLRRAAKTRPDAAFADQAEVDIYLHRGPDGQLTEGSRWAGNLKPGDIILSNAEYHEHTEHLHQGQVVLIGDETALPTVAAILENWRNPQAPVVFSITAHADDQAYLPDSLLPAGAVCHRISGSADVGAAVLDGLATLPQIDAAWGALENTDAKAVRLYLRNTRGMKGSSNRVKGYWKRQDAADAADAAGKTAGVSSGESANAA